MGCCASTNAVVVAEADWDEETRAAVKEVEDWEMPKALEAAKASAFAGGDRVTVMAAANSAREANPAEEEIEKQETEAEESPEDEEVVQEA